MAETNVLLKKDSFFISITKWKKEGVKELATKNAVNTSQLIENFLTEYFCEDLDQFRPEEERESQPSPHQA
jgi:hypothetical protein